MRIRKKVVRKMKLRREKIRTPAQRHRLFLLDLFSSMHGRPVPEYCRSWRPRWHIKSSEPRSTAFERCSLLKSSSVPHRRFLARVSSEIVMRQEAARIVVQMGREVRSVFEAEGCPQ